MSKCPVLNAHIYSTHNKLKTNSITFLIDLVSKQWLIRSLSAAARPLTFNWLEQDGKIDQQEKLRVGKRDESDLYL